MTGAIIGAVGTVLAAIATVLVGYFVRRTDRAAKLAQAGLRDQVYVLKLVGALRDDYWSSNDYVHYARDAYMALRARFKEHTGQDWPLLNPIPRPKHRDLEERHNNGEDVTDGPEK